MRSSWMSDETLKHASLGLMPLLVELRNGAAAEEAQESWKPEDEEKSGLLSALDREPVAQQDGVTARASLKWHRLGSLAVLALCSSAYLGMTVGSDAVRVLELDLKKSMNLTDTRLGAVFSPYNVAATVSVLVGGLLIDTLGLHASCLLFALLCVLGMLLQCTAGEELHGQVFALAQSNRHSVFPQARRRSVLPS